MPNILIAVDGSENSLRAVDYIAKLYGKSQDVELHLVNSQPSLPGDVTMFIDANIVKKFHEEQGSQALKTARDMVEKVGLRYVLHIGVGEPARVIAQYATQHGCQQIVVGTRGLGSVVGMLLGSVATKIVHLSTVPVLLVK